MDNVLIFSEDGLSVIGCDKTYSGEIIIPNSVTRIGERAFQECSGLTSITIPISVTSIGKSAFSGCIGLTSITIPDSVKNLEEYAFYNCKGLTSVTIPNSITHIGEHAFSGCSGLVSIVVEERNIRYDSRNKCNAIIETLSNTLIVGCKNTTIPSSVTSIGACAFSRCSGLTSISIPTSVTSIENYAFSYCSGLTSITIPNNVMNIGEGAFSWCSGLNSVTIPNSVTSIEAFTFAKCNGLISVTIPNSVTSIRKCAFYCCGLTTVTIGNSVTSIGEFAFFECSDLTSITIPTSVTNIGGSVFRGCSGLSSIKIPDSVTNIGDWAFDGCRSLTSIKIPSSVTKIGSRFFSGCSGLTSVIIPNSVTNIGEYAFCDCCGLTSITIPDSVTSIEEDAFSGCDVIEEIIIPKGTREKYEEILPDKKDKLVEIEQNSEELSSDGELLLFFDTETTGFPNDWNAPSSDVTNWPRIVQISWIVSDIRGQIISKQNYIVKPEGFSIPLEVSQIHGITTERALEEGEKLNNILDHFLRDLQNVSYVVGHNISFDKNVVEAELYRIGGERHLDEVVIDKYVDMLENKPTICTMLSSTNYCRIPRFDNGYKWPKLSELYDKLFNKELVDAHDSSVDIQATFDCFWKLVELGVIDSVDADDTINGKEEPIHYNKMRFTSFKFNSSVYSGYGEPTSDFIKRLYTREWKLFVSNETPQDLMFSYPNTLHVMDNGRGVSGTYTLKDKDSLLLSIDGESFYLHCVYYNEEIIIFQFDQSNEHLLLYPKGFAFSSVRDIHEYLDRVKQYVNSQRKKARKEKAIELQNRVESLIKDITRTDVEISDKRVATLERELKQLASIVGQKEVEKYQSIIYKVIEDNNNRKKVIEEEKKKKEEEKKRKKAKTIKNSSISFVIVLYTVLWLTAFFNHSSYEWETCGLILLWSSLILFLLVIATIIEFKNIVLPNVAKYIHISFGIITIICSCIYMSDWSKFQKCFNDRVFNPFVSASYYASNEENPINDYHNFSAVHGDDYLNETTFHLFDKAVRRIISVQINHSEDLVFLQKYISHNKSGYYLQEAKQMVYFASDQLVRKAETLGDWKYIIDNAPLEYLSDAQREYARLDSIVWNDEELAYHNTKSLNSTEACEKFLKLFKKSSHEIEISNLCLEIRKSEEMRDRIDRLKKEKKSKKRHRFFWLNN